MYRVWEDALVQSGNAVKLESPVHMDMTGKVVLEEAALGWMVTHKIIRPENVLVLDETGANTLFVFTFTAIFIFTFFDCLQAAALFPSRRSINKSDACCSRCSAPMPRDVKHGNMSNVQLLSHK